MAPNQGGCLGHARGEPAAAQDRQIRQIVAHGRGCLGRQVSCFSSRSNTASLSPHPLEQVGNPEVLGAQLNCARSSSGNDRHLDTARAQHFEPEPVVDVKRFELIAVGAVVERAIGQYAVDVQNQEPDATGARAQIGSQLQMTFA